MSVQGKCRFLHSKIWDELFFKVRVSFDGMVSRNKVFSEYSHRIDTHLDVVLEVPEFHSSFAFEFCLDKEFVWFWWDDLMFESPHDTNFLECPPYYGGAFLLDGTAIVGYWDFGEYLLSGK